MIARTSAVAVLLAIVFASVTLPRRATSDARAAVSPRVRIAARRPSLVHRQWRQR